jgi:thiamine-phosphate pyrophosphorylase
MPASARRARLLHARLYLVCDALPGGRELLGVLSAAIAGGVDIVQLRDKRMQDRELTALARAAAILCKQRGALLIVNDRPQVALAAGADGVHLGQDDMAVAHARALLGPELLIGLSTHRPAEIDAAQGAQGMQGTQADYLGVGPVHATPTKPGRPAVGLELVRYAADHAQQPFFAIGGIDAGNIHAVLDAGATRVAVVRAVAEAEDPETAARALRSALEAKALEAKVAAAP